MKTFFFLPTCCVHIETHSRDELARKKQAAFNLCSFVQFFREFLFSYFESMIHRFRSCTKKNLASIMENESGEDRRSLKVALELMSNTAKAKKLTIQCKRRNENTFNDAAWSEKCLHKTISSSSTFQLSTDFTFYFFRRKSFFFRVLFGFIWRLSFVSFFLSRWYLLPVVGCVSSSHVCIIEERPHNAFQQYLVCMALVWTDLTSPNFV